MADRAASSSWRANSAVQDPRRARNRRRESAVQIRKQRKEQVLRRKRGLPSNAAAAAAVAGGVVANSVGTSSLSLETCLAAYLQNPRDLSCHRQLENALSLATNNSSCTSTSSSSVTAVGATAAAAAAAAAGTTSATDFLQRLLDEEQAKARALVSNLIDSVQQSQVMLLRESALGILLEVSSSVKSQQDTTYSCATTTNNDDYYGSPPLRWSDILVSTDAEREPNVVMVLLSLLPPPPLQQQQQQQQQQPAINGGDSTVETILNILGNLVQDSPQALSLLLPHWAILTSHLPASAYCCAAIIRSDQTHYAMDFLQAQQPQQQHISPLQLTQLLRDDRTAVEAAWILEGLSRREDEAVHVLCGRRQRMVEEKTAKSAAEEADMLLPCLIQRIHHHSTTSTTTASKEFLVPALRAIGNLCTACEGQYVVDFLQQQQPAFVEAMNRLLEQKSILDAVYVSGCLLTDAGLPGHPSTDTALPNFLPRLIAILLSEHSTFAWKRDAAFAISNAVASSTLSQLPSSPGAVVVYEHDDALLQRMEIESYRLAQLRYYVWTDSEEHQHRLMQVLGGEFLKITPSSSSHEAVVPALEILDKLVRNIEASRFLFDSHGGVDLLEDVCANSSSSTTDEAAEIAARLIDDIFDTDDGDSIDYEASSLSMPAIENNQFVFGGAPAIAAFRSDSATSMETTTPPQAGAGRGRGRTMPAWMVQQQRQQS